MARFDDNAVEAINGSYIGEFFESNLRNHIESNEFSVVCFRPHIVSRRVICSIDPKTTSPWDLRLFCLCVQGASICTSILPGVGNI